MHKVKFTFRCMSLCGQLLFSSCPCWTTLPRKITHTFYHQILYKAKTLSWVTSQKLKLGVWNYIYNIPIKCQNPHPTLNPSLTNPSLKRRKCKWIIQLLHDSPNQPTLPIHRVSSTSTQTVSNPLCIYRNNKSQSKSQSISDIWAFLIRQGTVYENGSKC